jgi:hypothetical protein
MFTAIRCRSRRHYQRVERYADLDEALPQPTSTPRESSGGGMAMDSTDYSSLPYNEFYKHVLENEKLNMNNAFEEVEDHNIFYPAEFMFDYERKKKNSFVHDVMNKKNLKTPQQVGAFLQSCLTGLDDHRGDRESTMKELRHIFPEKNQPSIERAIRGLFSRMFRTPVKTRQHKKWKEAVMIVDMREMLTAKFLFDPNRKDESLNYSGIANKKEKFKNRLNLYHESFKSPELQVGGVSIASRFGNPKGMKFISDRKTLENCNAEATAGPVEFPEPRWSQFSHTVENILKSRCGMDRQMVLD